MFIDSVNENKGVTFEDIHDVFRETKDEVIEDRGLGSLWKDEDKTKTEDDKMRAKSRYEVIAELEDKKRRLMQDLDNFDDMLNKKNKELKELNRRVEDKEEEIEQFEENMEDKKETIRELIKSTEHSLDRLSQVSKSN